MSNDYFTADGTPATHAFGASATARSVQTRLETAFDKLPTLTGKASLPVFVNAGETALETLSLASARTALGLGSGSSVTFSALTVTNALTAGTVNGNTITTGTGVLTLGAGKTVTISNTLTFTGTDSSTLAIGTGGTLGTAAYTAASAYATSAQGSTADAAMPKAGGTFTGNVLFTNTTIDIGDGTHQARDLYLSRNAFVGTSLRAGDPATGITLRANSITTEGFNGVDVVNINYTGYTNSTTQFRNFAVHDGKQNAVFSAVGSTKALTFHGHVAGTPTRAAGDCYLLVDASGNVHVSAIGPAS